MNDDQVQQAQQDAEQAKIEAERARQQADKAKKEAEKSAVTGNPKRASAAEIITGEY